MRTSQLAALFKPEGSNKISVGALGYIRARNRLRAYNLIIREFKKSGISQADLARRLNKAPEIVSRLLSRPSNWGVDTLGDLLFAISGAVLKFDIYPLVSKQEDSTDLEVVQSDAGNTVIAQIKTTSLFADIFKTDDYEWRVRTNDMLHNDEVEDEQPGVKLEVAA